MKTGGVHHCLECAKEIITGGKLSGCIGWLSKEDLIKYNLAINSSQPREFLLEGLTTVPIDVELREFIHEYTARHLCESNPTPDNLAHDTSGAIERSAGGRQNPGRKWCPLYPRDRYTMSYSISDKNCIMKRLAYRVNELVTRAVLPHLRYSQIAYQMMNETVKPNLRGINCRNSVDLSEPLLEVDSINLLWRGYHKGMIGREGRQSIHMDGNGYRIVAIVPLQCHTRGYEIFSVPKSHRINNWEYDWKKVKDKIPYEVAKAVMASIGEIIVFSERLLHAGGTCSKVEGSKVSTPTFTSGVLKKNGAERELFNGWFGQGKNMVAGTQPTDVAVQFNFKLILLENCTAMKGNGGDNIWTLNECWEEGDSSRVSRFQKRLDKLPDDVDKANDDFVKGMKEAQAMWLKCLSTNTAFKAGRK